jgi:hypothetical protein
LPVINVLWSRDRSVGKARGWMMEV